MSTPQAFNFNHQILSFNFVKVSLKNQNFILPFQNFCLEVHSSIPESCVKNIGAFVISGR